MQDELFNQGLRSIEDALYVRDRIIRHAVAGERWNIVVYETQRATELLVRGMICQVGFKPLEHHDISGHINFLCERLPGARNAIIPFTIGAYTNTTDWYGIILESGAVNNILLVVLNSGTRTTLAAAPIEQLPQDGRIDLRFELSGTEVPEVKVYLNGSIVLEYSDTSVDRLLGPFKLVDRSFIRRPQVEKIRLLKKLGDRLTRDRSVAFYSEREYTEDDAKQAISYMNESFEITKSFYFFE